MQPQAAPPILHLERERERESIIAKKSVGVSLARRPFGETSALTLSVSQSRSPSSAGLYTATSVGRSSPAYMENRGREGGREDANGNADGRTDAGGQLMREEKDRHCSGRLNVTVGEGTRGSRADA